ncbi:MAG: flagella basal body P-ring formation protein FlgA [Candidatus Korobacteraceae bacterium]
MAHSVCGLLLFLLLGRAPGGAATSAEGGGLRQQVAAAIARDLGVSRKAAETDLVLLATMPTLPPGEQLHVVSVKPGFTPGTWFLKLDCSARPDCLPFAALLRSDDLDLSGGRRQGRSGLTPAVRPRRILLAADAMVVRGERAELVEQLASMRLMVPAICLESGALGDRIRVRNLATRRVLSAAVVGKGQLRVE